MKDNKVNISLSVVEIEDKYTVSPAEPVTGGDKIVSWGKDNTLPSLLSTCYDESATLKAVIDQTINYVKGDDVVVSDSAAMWREKVNRRGLTMEEFVEHIAGDLLTYGNFAVQVVFNKLGNPMELFPLDVTRCRINETQDKVFYAKKGWTKYSSKSDVYQRFGHCEFDPENPTQIYFYNGTGVRRAYNRAPWFSALDDVLTEIESSHYSLNSVSNGFSAKYVFNLPQTANLTDEQKKAIEDGIKTKFCGPDSNSNFMLYWNDGEQGLDIKKIESNEDPDHYIAIRNGARENIFVAMRISPLLCGLSLSNTGFATSEFSDSYKLFDKTVAQPYRNLIQNAIDKMTGVDNAVEIKPFVVDFNQE